MAVSKTIALTFHFAEIDDSTNEVVKTRRISFTAPANAAAADYDGYRFYDFRNSYLANFANATPTGLSTSIGSLVQAAGWADNDFDGDGSNVDYKCVDVTAEFVETEKTELTPGVN